MVEQKNIPISSPSVGEQELRNISEAVSSGMLAFGSFQDKFIASLAHFHKVESSQVVLVSNGTVALHLALATLRIGDGDEVIIPATSFVATLNAVLYTGATPVFVDVEPSSWGIDVEKIEAAITDKTKAIIPVHLYGNPCYIDRVVSIAFKHGLAVIEDNAESLGATYKGQLTGTFGDCSTFSFYGNKIITTGEGGALIFKDSDMANRAKILASHGMSPQRRYYHEEVGFNYRMTNMQAAIGCAQMERIDEILEKREMIRRSYDANLNCGSPTIFSKDGDMTTVNWLYSIFVNDPAVLEERLREFNIDSRRMFTPLHRLPYVGSNELFQNAEFLFNKGLSLPTYIDLDEGDILRVCDIVNAYESS